MKRARGFFDIFRLFFGLGVFEAQNSLRQKLSNFFLQNLDFSKKTFWRLSAEPNFCSEDFCSPECSRTVEPEKRL
jgi:hypothetical protein